jgi:hypothetical protein
MRTFRIPPITTSSQDVRSTITVKETSSGWDTPMNIGLSRIREWAELLFLKPAPTPCFSSKGPTATLSVNSFNVLNHANDTTYVGVVSSPLFGRGVAAQPPRRMQLDLEFRF